MTNVLNIDDYDLAGALQAVVSSNFAEAGSYLMIALTLASAFWAPDGLQEPRPATITAAKAFCEERSRRCAGAVTDRAHILSSRLRMV